MQVAELGREGVRHLRPALDQRHGAGRELRAGGKIVRAPGAQLHHDRHQGDGHFGEVDGALLVRGVGDAVTSPSSISRFSRLARILVAMPSSELECSSPQVR